jgi:hypothetical protein
VERVERRDATTATKLFAHAALRPTTFGKAYTATRQQHTTWSEYYRQVSAALGKEAQLICLAMHALRFSLVST